MKTFREFVNDWYCENMDQYPSTIEESNEYLESLINAVLEEDQHFGNCIKEINSCLMCELTDLLNEYWIYTKENHPRLKNRN